MSSIFSTKDKSQRILTKYPKVRLILLALLIVVIGVISYNAIKAIVPHSDAAFESLSGADQKALKQLSDAYAALENKGTSDASILIRKSDSDASGTWLIFDGPYIGINISGIENESKGVQKVVMPDGYNFKSVYILYNAPRSAMFTSGNFLADGKTVSFLDSSPVFVAKYNAAGLDVSLQEKLLAFFS